MNSKSVENAFWDRILDWPCGKEVPMPVLMRLLAGEGYRTVMQRTPADGSYLVQADCYQPTRGKYFFVWDNGGEVGVEELNSGKIPTFTPLTTSLCPNPGPLTLLVRVKTLLEGEEIDYEEDWDAPAPPLVDYTPAIGVMDPSFVAFETAWMASESAGRR